MPRFETEAPIAVRVELGVGDVRLVAGERTDTVVEVRPSNEAKRDDVIAAEGTRVEYDDGRLLVKVPKTWRRYSFFSDGGAVDIEIELPAGSQVTGEAGVARLHGIGRFGDCRFTTGMGDIHLDDAGTLRLHTGMGDISVDRAAGDAEIRTSSGAVRLGTVDGNAVVKNSNGASWVGEATGDVRISSANGEIAIDRAQASVVAKTATGDIRLGALVRGSVVAETAHGDLEIGIADGTAAWLDAQTGFGQMRNELDVAGAPGPTDEAVEVRARTAYGDITVHRAP